jgi:hypothetical protein
MSLLDEITPLLITYNEIQNIERTSANMLVLPEGDQSAASAIGTRDRTASRTSAVSP